MKAAGMYLDNGKTRGLTALAMSVGMLLAACGLALAVSPNAAYAADDLKALQTTVGNLAATSNGENPEISASGTCGESATWTLDSNGKLVISGEGATASWTSTSQVPWKDKTAEITEVVIESGITSVGNYAFSSCPNLESVTIGDSVSLIGNYAFQNCSTLSAVTVEGGSHLSSIGDKAFSGCKSLSAISTTSKYVCSYVKNELKRADLYKSILESLPVYTGAEDDDGAASLRYAIDADGSSAWIVGVYENLSYQTVPYAIGENAIDKKIVVGIAEGAFTITNDEGNVIDNTALRKIEFASAGDIVGGSKVAVIEDGAFEWCSSLARFDAPAALETVGANAFCGCRSIEEFNFGGSAPTSIGDNAFRGCESLQSIEIPSSVESIGAHAFDTLVINGAQFGSVNEVSFQNNVSAITEIGFATFNGCKSVTLGEGTEVIGSNAFNSSLIEANLPQSLKRISSSGFHGCKLLEIEIPSAVESIGASAFQGCSSLSRVTFSPQASITSIGASAFSGCRSIPEFLIPDTVSELGAKAFRGCESLQAIRIPLEVETLGDETFYNCESLTSAVFAEGSKLTSIGASAFEGCVKLGSPAEVGQSSSSIEFPSTLTTIGNKAFKGTSALGGISFEPGENPALASIGEYAFENCKSITSIELPVSVKWLYQAAFKDCSKLEKVKILNTNMYLGRECFVGIANPSCIVVAKAENGASQAFETLERNDNLLNADATDIRIDGGTGYWISEDNENCVVTASNVVYAGENTIPEVTVKCDGKELKQGEQYSVTVVGKAQAGSATALVRGIKETGCVGFVRVPFTILSAEVQPPVAQTELVYNGSKQTGVASGGAYTVKNASATRAGTYTAEASLVDKTNCVWADSGDSADKQIEWSIACKPVVVTAKNATKIYGTNDPYFSADAVGTLGSDKVKYSLSRDQGQNVGDYVISVSGQEIQGNYAVTFQPGTLTIKQCDLSEAVVTLKQSTLAYTGEQLKPAVSAVKVGSKTIKEDEGYSVSYANNVDPGTATVVVSGLKNYTGIATKTFTIAATVNAPIAKAGLIYDGSEQHGFDASDLYVVKTNGAATNAGTYTATISLADKEKSVWADTRNTADKRVKWSIARKPVTVTAADATKEYGDADPKFTASLDGVLNGDEGKIRYSVSRAKSGENVGEYGIKVTGSASQGNYTVTFAPGKLTIKKKDVSTAVVSLGQTSFEYTGQAIKPAVSSVKLGTKTLKAGTDYGVSYTNNTKVGTASVVVTGMGSYEGTASKAFTIKRAAAQQKTGIAVGATAKVGGATYRAASATTVVYKKAPAKKAKVKIPAAVTIKGKRYKVVGIAAKAFKGSKAKTVIVKAKKLTKKSVRKCFAKSKVKTVKAPASKKKLYKIIFNKKNAGKKVKVK